MSTILHLFINRYRFVELKYRRSEQNKKDGGDNSIKPARIENVVIFLPDIHSCMPNRTEWDGIQQQYKKALEKLLTEPEQDSSAEAASTADKVDESKKDEAVTADNSSKIAEDTEIVDAAAGVPDSVSTSGAVDDDGAKKDLSIVNLASLTKSNQTKKQHRLMKNHKLSNYGFF